MKATADVAVTTASYNGEDNKLTLTLNIKNVKIDGKQVEDYTATTVTLPATEKTARQSIITTTESARTPSAIRLRPGFFLRKVQSQPTPLAAQAGQQPWHNRTPHGTKKRHKFCNTLFFTYLCIALLCNRQTGTAQAAACTQMMQLIINIRIMTQRKKKQL